MPKCPYCDNEVDELELEPDEPEPRPRLTPAELVAIASRRYPSFLSSVSGAVTVAEITGDELEGE